MRRTLPLAAAGVAMVVALNSPIGAQGLHVNPDIRDCSIEFDPSLSQSDFRKFIGEGGELLTFRAFSGPAPLGRGRVSIGLMTSKTYLDDLHPSWNNTFTHPDEHHRLGNLDVPAVFGAIGVTDRVDIGAYFTKNPDANYGFVGAAARYALRAEAGAVPATSVTASYVRLFGPDDLRFDQYMLDLTASRRVAAFTPYGGLRTALARGAETTTNVDLNSEAVVGAQGYAGVHYRVARLDLTLEGTYARQASWSFKTGYTFGRRR